MGAGDFSLETVDDVPVGWHPIPVTRVWTSTTAINIVAVWR